MYNQGKKIIDKSKITMLHLQVDQRKTDLGTKSSKKLTKLQFHKAGMLQNCTFSNYNTYKVPNVSKRENPCIFRPGL